MGQNQTHRSESAVLDAAMLRYKTRHDGPPRTLQRPFGVQLQDIEGAFPLVLGSSGRVPVPTCRRAAGERKGSTPVADMPCCVLVAAVEPIGGARWGVEARANPVRLDPGQSTSTVSCETCELFWFSDSRAVVTLIIALRYAVLNAYAVRIVVVSPTHCSCIPTGCVGAVSAPRVPWSEGVRHGRRAE